MSPPSTWLKCCTSGHTSCSFPFLFSTHTSSRLSYHKSTFLQRYGADRPGINFLDSLLPSRSWPPCSSSCTSTQPSILSHWQTTDTTRSTFFDSSYATRQRSILPYPSTSSAPGQPSPALVDCPTSSLQRNNKTRRAPIEITHGKRKFAEGTEFGFPWRLTPP